MPVSWRDLSQRELDDAYDQSVWAANRDAVLARYAGASAAARERLGSPERFAYGSGPREGLDVFRSSKPKAPIVLFVHGGAWRTGMAHDHAFPAPCITGAGAHYVVPDFDWVQDRGGDLLAIAEQIRRAVEWTLANAARFDGDPDRVYLVGHSSGAHMAAVILASEGLAGRFRGALLVSGIYDLAAPRRSARSAYVAFTDEMERALSPARHLPRIQAPLVLAHGEAESPEFVRQTRDFHAALAAAGKPARLLEAAGRNHFEVLESLAAPEGLLGRALSDLRGGETP